MNFLGCYEKCYWSTCDCLVSYLLVEIVNISCSGRDMPSKKRKSDGGQQVVISKFFKPSSQTANRDSPGRSKKKVVRKFFAMLSCEKRTIC